MQRFLPAEGDRLVSRTETKAATYKDLFSLPHNVVGEILAGELVTHSRPAPRHARAASVIGARLLSEFDTRSDGEGGDWWILYEPECHLGEDILVPNSAGWRKTTMPELPDTAWFPVRPDWVCEVLSPATAKYDRGVKREIYAREGVGHYWLVDLVERIVEVFALQDSNWMLIETATDNAVASLVPFETLPFDLAALWASR